VFVDNLYAILEQMASGEGHLAEDDVEVILGKCGRLAFLIPAVKPFVSALWGAFSASRAAAEGHRPEAPKGRHAARRFAMSARWVRVLLRPLGDVSGITGVLLPLENYVKVRRDPITLAGPSVQVDASPWGGGAVLLIAGTPVEHASCTWSARTAKRFRVDLGSPRGQTAWEYLVILQALMLWGARYQAAGLAILGDNMAALNGAISLKGKSEIALITRELAWRKVRFGWHFACAHLPSEHNELADALSRLTAPRGNRKCFPPALRASAARLLPDPESLWTCD